MDGEATAAHVGGRTRHARAALGLALFLLAPAASAQYSMVDDASPRFEWRGKVAADFRSEFETKSDAGDEFDAWRTGIEGEFGGPINESILVGMGVRYAHASYDFNLDNGIPPAYGGIQLPREPWNSLNTIDLLPSATVLIGDRISVVTLIPMRWAGESGADKNGFAAGASVLVRWHVNDAITVGAGIGVTSQLEDEAETFPIISLRWRIAEGLELNTEGDWFQGGNATLLLGSSEAIRMIVSLGYERTRFRLDGFGSAADTDGVGEITSVPLEVGIQLRFMEEAYLEVRTGLGLVGRVRVETDGGNELYDQRYDAAPRVGVSFTFPIGLPSR